MSVLVQLDNYVKSVGKNTFGYFVKGGEACLPVSKPNDEHAWRWGERDEKMVTSYPFPTQSGLYYPGCILLANDKFHSENPTSISFKPSERKPLNVTTTLYSNSASSVNTFNTVNAGSILNDIRKKFVEPALNDRQGSISEEVEPKIEYFSESSGFELGGSISLKSLGLSFGASETQSRQVLLITFTQRMFRVSINDVYTAASDLFTEQLDLPALKGVCKRSTGSDFPLAMINNVVYGRTVYLLISTTDYSFKLNAEITLGKFKAGAKIDKKLQKCSFHAKVVGGKPGTFNGLTGLLSLDNADKLIERAMKTFDKSDVDSAAPIEFSAYFLDNMKVRDQLTTTVNRRYAEMVYNIRLHISRQTSGTLAKTIMRNLYPIRDKNGVLYWALNQKEYSNINETSAGLFSPHACFFEFKIDKHGDTSDSWDYNVWVPEIPLDKLTRGSDGYYVFTFIVKGMTSTKQHATSPYTRSIQYNRNNVVLYYGDSKCYFNNSTAYKNASKATLKLEFDKWIAQKKREKGESSFIENRG